MQQDAAKAGITENGYVFQNDHAIPVRSADQYRATSLMGIALSSHPAKTKPKPKQYSGNLSP
jgi:hypothetical protein